MDGIEIRLKRVENRLGITEENRKLEEQNIFYKLLKRIEDRLNVIERKLGGSGEINEALAGGSAQREESPYPTYNRLG